MSSRWKCNHRFFNSFYRVIVDAIPWGLQEYKITCLIQLLRRKRSSVMANKLQGKPNRGKTLLGTLKFRFLSRLFKTITTSLQYFTLSHLFWRSTLVMRLFADRINSMTKSSVTRPIPSTVASNLQPSVGFLPCPYKMYTNDRWSVRSLNCTLNKYW